MSPYTRERLIRIITAQYLLVPFSSELDVTNSGEARTAFGETLGMRFYQMLDSHTGVEKYWPTISIVSWGDLRGNLHEGNCGFLSIWPGVIQRNLRRC
jgi:hypothetical protein